MNGPKITEEYLKSIVTLAEYYVFPKSLTTICQLTVVNGFTAIGTSACVSPKNFNTRIGQDVAYKNAFEQLWRLEGYLLKQSLYLIDLDKDKGEGFE